MDKLYGYAGKLLRVDLTNEQITEEKLDEETARKYIGGTGIGARYLYEEVPAGVEWSDEGNRIIMASGPLGGTRVPGSGTFSVVTKGPLTNGAIAAEANGLFGAYLRFSGYDGIILQGRAKRWVYLHIHQGRAELRDASHLLGKDNWETTDLIKSELGVGEREMSVTSIGQAGENLVKFACPFTDKGHTAAHGGAGAVMGSKKLKAIAVARGRAGPTLKDREGLSAIVKQRHDDIMNDPLRSEGGKWGTLMLFGRHKVAGTLPVKNYTSSVYDIDQESLEKFTGPYIRSHTEPKPNPCWACDHNHCNTITLTEGPYKGYVGEEPEYECLAGFSSNIGVTDYSVATFLANETDRLGMDANAASWALSLAIECYEKGIITLKDTDGIELTWGNYEAVNKMLHRIATRQGFGDVLAEGPMRAAQRIGGEAPNFAIHTMKGNTPRGHDHRNRWGMLFDTCLSQMGTDEGFQMEHPEDLGLWIKPVLQPCTSAEDAVLWNAYCKGAWGFTDCLVVCRSSAGSDLRVLARAVSAATGWDFSIGEAMEVGRRIHNLLRVFNIKHGHTAEMDAPSPRYGSTPVDGPAQGKSIMSSWNEMRSKYYELMGWDKETGKPLPDTLRHLGLEHTIPELWGK